MYSADCSTCLKALCLPFPAVQDTTLKKLSTLIYSSLFRWTRAWGSIEAFALAAFTARWAKVCPIPNVTQLEESKAFCEGSAVLVVIFQALVTCLAKHLPRLGTLSSCLSTQVLGDLKIFFCRLDIRSQIYQRLVCWNKDRIWDCALRTARTASSNFFDKVALLFTGWSWWCVFVIEALKMRDIGSQLFTLCSIIWFKFGIEWDTFSHKTNADVFWQKLTKTLWIITVQYSSSSTGIVYTALVWTARPAISYVVYYCFPIGLMIAEWYPFASFMFLESFVYTVTAIRTSDDPLWRYGSMNSKKCASARANVTCRPRRDYRSLDLQA